MTVDIFMPIATKSESNERGQSVAARAIKSKRFRAQRETACLLMRDARNRGIVPSFDDYPRPRLIRLVRVGMNKRPMDKGNVPSAVKAVQDGIADAFGIDDGKLQWSYDAEYTNKREKTGVMVTLEYEGD